MIAQASPAAGPLRADPSKRVNYTLGLVLGVDEFQQDQLYHAAGRRGHNRLLHGYGTVWGLKTAYAGGGDPEIQVDPGIALDPCGREICVPDRMCVKLTRWLDRHRPALEPLYPDPTAQPIPLAVILCHRECPTDTVPVPGEPCRTQEDAMAASRIRESFELKLALRDDAPWGSPPAVAPTGLTVFRLSQPEEQAVRAFGLILARVQSTTDEALGADGEATLLAAVYALREAADEGTLASPPTPTDDPILLPAAEAPEILRRALRLWVTEVRPAIRALEGGGECGTDADGECCVLLAELDLNVTAGWAVQVNQPPLREDLRPYLLHTRLLQEWLIATGGEDGRPDVDSWASLQILGPNRIRVWVHHAEWVDLPPEALTVVINDVALAPEQVVEVPYGGIRNVWDIVISREMSDGDVVEIHFDTELVPVVHGPVEIGPRDAERRPRIELPNRGPRVPGVREQLVDGPWLPSTAERTGVSIADELNGPTGEYLDRYGRYLVAFTVYDRIQGGDLEGEYKLPIVVKIQQFPVDPAAPAADQYLVSDGAKWLPRYLPDGTRDLEGRYPDNTVRGIQGVGVSPSAPAADQYLFFDGTQWVPAHLPDGRQDLAGRYPDSTVTGLQTTPVSSAQPGLDQYLFYDQVTDQWIPANLPDATGDLVGRYPSLEIVRLQKNPVEAATPQENEALAFVGGRWVPVPVPELMGNAGGDLRGDYPDPRVVGLRGRPIDPAAPADGEILVFREGGSPPDEGRWVPEAIAFSVESDLGGTYPHNQIARLQGRPVDAQNPADGQVLRYEESSPPGNGFWVPADLPSGGIGGDAGGDLSGTYPNPSIARLQGRILDAANAAAGQILRFQESSPPGNGRWVAVNLPGTSGAASGDLGGTYPNPSIARLQGRILQVPNPTDGQVLLYRESSPPGNGRWIAVNPPSGGGTTGPAGGDLGGSFPDPQVLALSGIPMKLDALEPGQSLHFDKDQGVWAPGFTVGAPRAGYQIVAAGQFDFSAIESVVAESTWNELKLTFVGTSANNPVYQLDFPGYDPASFSYIVKGTAGAGFVGLFTRDPLQIEIISGFSTTKEGRLLHLEVSAFPRNPPNERGGGLIRPRGVEGPFVRGSLTDESAPILLTADATETTDAAPAPAKKTTRKRPSKG